MIFMFDSQCDQCAAVYHLNCLNEMVPCPKCERKTKHELSKFTEDGIDDDTENVVQDVQEVL